MKVLTLTQPWATLVAVGAKRIETRSWGTSYRGALFIHAAKRFPKEARELCLQQPFRSALEVVTSYPEPGRFVMDLPLGEIVAVCRLTYCTEMGPNVRETVLNDWGADELAFGNYAPGRFAWGLRGVLKLPEPIPAKGRLSLWESGEALDAYIQAQLETLRLVTMQRLADIRRGNVVGR